MAESGHLGHWEQRINNPLFFVRQLTTQSGLLEQRKTAQRRSFYMRYLAS